MRIEAGQHHGLIHHVRAVVKHDHATGPQHRALFHTAFVIEQAALGLLSIEHGHRGATGYAGLERPSLPHTAAEIVDEFT